MIVLRCRCAVAARVRAIGCQRILGVLIAALLAPCSQTSPSRVVTRAALDYFGHDGPFLDEVGSLPRGAGKSLASRTRLRVDLAVR